MSHSSRWDKKEHDKDKHGDMNFDYTVEWMKKFLKSMEKKLDWQNSKDNQ